MSSSSATRGPPPNCLKAHIKFCFCGRKAALKISQQQWSKHCQFYTCPGYAEGGEKICSFFMWVEALDEGDANEEVNSRRQRVDSRVQRVDLEDLKIEIKGIIVDVQQKMEKMFVKFFIIIVVLMVVNKLVIK